MSIPLIQEATKDAINTSIIAIKRNIERINTLLGLVDSSSPDLSGLATKQELQDAVNSLQPVDEVTLNNMQSVTSNAVAKAGSYSTIEHKTGRYWIDRKPTYEKTLVIDNLNTGETYINIDNLYDLINYHGNCILTSFSWYRPFPWIDGAGRANITRYINGANGVVIIYSDSALSAVRITLEYTKTTD